MGCSRKTCPLHGRPGKRSASEKNRRHIKSCPSNRSGSGESDLKCRQRTEDKITAEQTHSPKRCAPSGSRVEKISQEHICKVHDSRSRNTSGEISVRQAPASAPRHTNAGERVKCHKKHCSKHRASSVNTNSTEKAYSINAKDKKKSRVKCASTSGSSHTTEQDSSNKKKCKKGSASYRTLTRKKGLSKPLRVLRDSGQSLKYVMFYASDMIDLARRERRRKAAVNKSRLIRSKSFIHVRHPKAPEGISPSDRLDSFDEHFLRIKLEKGTMQIQKRDVLRWINNDTQETLRMLAKLHLNKIRTKRHLRELDLDLYLSKASGKHNYDQAYLIRDGKTHHKDSNGKDLNARLNSIDYKSCYAFELLAKGPESVSELLEYFMHCSCYRKIILHPSLRAMGIHGGKDLLGNWFWTLILCG